MIQQISKAQARALWMRAQGLNQRTPFGKGPGATRKAVEQLGYVQIDTISVIERCHHHILFTRIPDYKRQHLQKAQSTDKSVFEYWTHALAYIPTKDFRYFMAEMQRIRKFPSAWWQTVTKAEMQKVLRTIKTEGPLSIRDIEDDVLVEKDHPWASRKPSKKALQLGFYTGRLVISERLGMLKRYDLTERHFAWQKKPKLATQKEILEYLLQRSLRSQSFVSLASLCYLDNKKKPEMQKLLVTKEKKGELMPIQIADDTKNKYWIRPEELESTPEQESLVHILSPFDPLVIQRKRLEAVFDYSHRFEAYIPKEKRQYGYFALPILVDDEIVAAIDLKTDRENKKVLMQKWTWLGKASSPARKRRIEEELHRFEKFQLEK